MRAKVFVVLLLALQLAGPTVAAAQPPPLPLPPPGAMPPPAPFHDPIGEALFPPDLVMAHATAIGLQDSQKSYIESEVLKAEPQFTKLQWRLQEAVETLVTLLKQPRVDESRVMTQLDKVLDLERQIKHAQLGLMIRVKNELTPDQQARLRRLRESAR